MSGVPDLATEKPQGAASYQALRVLILGATDAAISQRCSGLPTPKAPKARQIVAQCVPEFRIAGRGISAGK